MEINVVVADDDPMFRWFLQALLEDLPEIGIVGEAENGQIAVELAERLHPDLVIMDFSMPVMNGVEATRCIRGEDDASDPGDREWARPP